MTKKHLGLTDGLPRRKMKLLRVMKMSYILIAVIISLVYACITTYQIMHLKWVHIEANYGSLKLMLRRCNIGYRLSTEESGVSMTDTVKERSRINLR